MQPYKANHVLLMALLIIVFDIFNNCKIGSTELTFAVFDINLFGTSNLHNVFC